MHPDPFDEFDDTVPAGASYGEHDIDAELYEVLDEPIEEPE